MQKDILTSLDNIILSYSYDELTEKNVFLVDSSGRVVPRNTSAIKNLLLTEGCVKTADGALSLVHFIQERSLRLFVMDQSALFFLGISPTIQTEFDIQDSEDLEKGIVDFLSLVDVYYSRLSVCLDKQVSENII